MSNFNVTVESIQNSQLARQDNYLGKGYGYDRVGVGKMFKGYTDPNTKIYTPPTSP